MKTLINLLILSILVSAQSFGQLYITQVGETNFFSETPMENISAVNKTVGSIINTATNEVAVSMRMNSFDFPNKLMQEHFNENYMESGKFSTATFKGKINETIDYTKPGTYDVSATGQFTVHGVAKPKTIKGKLTVEAQKLSLVSDFDVSLTDHNIEIPQLVFVKIAQVIKVKNKFVFLPKK